MIQLLARPLAVLAAAGWLVSIVGSIALLAGVAAPYWLSAALFLALFPIWLCAVLLMNRLIRGVRQKDMWKAAFRGCPQWLRYAIWGSWGYTLVMLLLVAAGRPEPGGVGFTGVFFASALGIFVTTGATVAEPAQCVNGHPVGPFDKFCSECGAAIARARNLIS